jgi:hypothetical protein
MPASEAAARGGIVMFASVFGMSFGGCISRRNAETASQRLRYPSGTRRVTTGHNGED